MDKPENILSIVCPVPCIYRGLMIDGNANKQPSCCKNCEHLNCTKVEALPHDHNVCSEGLSFYVSTFDGLRLVLNGLIVEDRNHVLAGNRRKALKRLWVKHADVKEVIQRLQLLELPLAHEMLEAAKETISFLHDVRSSVGVLMSNCEDLISGLPGDSFSEKIQGLRRENQQLFNLYQAVNLLTDQLGLADVISNPESITYGQRSTSSIYPFIYKMAKLFEAKARSRHMHITVAGNTDISVLTYQSFQLVPLILLDNAIKYGNAWSTITARFSENAQFLDMSVTSIGEVVPEAERSQIFDRHIRGSNAEGTHPHGTGLGLYLAKQIVSAHGYDLFYDCDAEQKSNTFTLRIPKLR